MGLGLVADDLFGLLFGLDLVVDDLDLWLVVLGVLKVAWFSLLLPWVRANVPDNGCSDVLTALVTDT